MLSIFKQFLSNHKWFTIQKCFGPTIITPVHLVALFHSGEKLIGYAEDSTLLSVVPSPCVGVTVAESLNRGLNKFSQ